MDELMFCKICGRHIEPNASRLCSNCCEALIREGYVFLTQCKNCVYWQDNNNGYPHPECRWGHDETPDADDFCSYGLDKRYGKG